MSETETQKASTSVANDDAFYTQAWDEINDQNKTPNKVLWAKAFAFAEGDEKRTQAKYIELRVAQLQENYDHNQREIMIEAEKQAELEGIKKAQEKEHRQYIELLKRMQPLAAKIQSNGSYNDTEKLIEELGGTCRLCHFGHKNQGKFEIVINLDGKTHYFSNGEECTEWLKKNVIPSILFASGSTFTDTSTGIEFIFVKGGCFEMGDIFGDGNDDEKPVHEVCLSDFYMGKYPVTQGQWKAIMGDNPSIFKKCGDNYPLENVNWDDVQEFIGKLNGMSEKKYRLPTEAEWEYAARSGGKKEKYAGTSSDSDLGDYAWHYTNAEKITHHVGQKKPNGLGLYDMTGNVWEYVEDWYSEKYYRESSRDNPRGPSNDKYRGLRGGSWFSSAQNCRAASRGKCITDRRDNSYGFRLAVSALTPHTAIISEKITSEIKPEQKQQTSATITKTESVPPKPSTQQSVVAQVPEEKPKEKAKNLYEAIIGEKNRAYYIANFNKFDEEYPGLKASWNWAAFLGGGTWALYRKMYLWFFAFLGIMIVSGFIEKEGASAISIIVLLAPWIAFSIFANSLYHNSVKKKIADAQLSISDKSQLTEFLRNRGGVHTWVIWVCCLLPVIGILSAIAIPQLTR